MFDHNVVWMNQYFQTSFNCWWRERVKPLQFYCDSLLFVSARSRWKTVLLLIKVTH